MATPSRATGASARAGPAPRARSSSAEQQSRKARRGAAQGFAQYDRPADADNPHDGIAHRRRQKTKAVKRLRAPSQRDDDGRVQKIDGHHLPPRRPNPRRGRRLAMPPRDLCQRKARREPRTAEVRQPEREEPSPRRARRHPEIERHVHAPEEPAHHQPHGHRTPHAKGQQPLHAADHHDGRKQGTQEPGRDKRRPGAGVQSEASEDARRAPVHHARRPAIPRAQPIGHEQDREPGKIPKAVGDEQALHARTDLLAIWLRTPRVPEAAREEEPRHRPVQHPMLRQGRQMQAHHRPQREQADDRHDHGAAYTFS